MGQWVGPELAVFSGGLAVLAVVGIIGSGVPAARRFVIERSGEPAAAHRGRGH